MKDYAKLLKKLRKRKGTKCAEKTASQIVDEAIEKYAKSYDAMRKKQYWQLLKRLHGGTDDAVKTIRKTKDTGIYHGTESLDKVLKEGLKPGNRNMYGKGVYFGDKDLAYQYSNDVVRLKKPSELEGTKHLYPKTDKAGRNLHTKVNPRNASDLTNYTRTYGIGSAKKKFPEKEVSGFGLGTDEPIKLKDYDDFNINGSVSSILSGDKEIIRRNIKKKEFKPLFDEVRSRPSLASKSDNKIKDVLKASIMDGKFEKFMSPEDTQFVYRSAIKPELLKADKTKESKMITLGR